ncbi:MAG: formimidoylglutamate deiminase [Rhodobacteraceae bacterium]|nr:MAG: formimidoylglutamate deiminase [Paracoccaceae bacterium]
MQAFEIRAGRALLPEGWARDVRVRVGADGRVASVETGVPGDGDRVLLPALSNLHSHAFQRAMAGLAGWRAAGRDSFWSWRALMYRFLDRMTPEDVEAVSRFAFVEMMESGFAALAEFHYLHHQPGGAPYARLGEMAERVAAAAADAQIGLTLLPVLYCWSGVERGALEGGQRRFGCDLDRFGALMDASRSALGGLGPDARLGFAPHSLRAVDPESLAAVAAAYRDMPLHIHAAEQPQEVAAVEAAFGARPVAWLLENAGVDARWCLIHCTHMTAAETEGLARSGAVAGLCPVTEADLGDGIFNGVAYAAAGGRFGVGSDSNVLIGAAAELRALEYSQRLREGGRNMMAREEGSVGEALYAAALAGGAQALGRESGAIRAGAWADLVALDGAAPALEGLADAQILDGWIFGEGRGLVRDVWAAGRHAVRDGVHVARARAEAGWRAARARLLAP